MSPSPWMVPVTALRRNVGARRMERRSGRLGEIRVVDTSVRDGGAATVEVVLTVVLGGIEVAGTVGARWESSCRRCLRPLQGTVECPVRELYRPAGEDDEETYALGADQLDLEPLARDALLLALPLAPLCSDDCQGLCPLCGAERAGAPCGCDPVGGDPRWAPLQALVSGAWPEPAGAAEPAAAAAESAPPSDLRSPSHPSHPSDPSDPSD